ncbi:hypothetical protein FHS19_000249 [Paenibacillus rhizosphaerae]|uniref:Uncharacterized protein n=1 Tax=Paenibacillus rhizosphaerae TaxID=297318 RepID=A0A839TFM2_9BACL|nr:hypothetical protein [Paenibacillus rhizosphaerae]MBB3125595.1 hypothetical protein [Paenibacillus rhizosphaerae]
MPNFLVDTQVSQNASTAGGISIPLGPVINLLNPPASALFGTLGLNTSTAGTDLRVVFNYTFTLSALISVLTPVTITVNRIINGVPTTVYSVTQTLPLVAGALTTTVLSGDGIDYHPPNPGFIVYQGIVSVPATVLVVPTRTGPESFNAAAYSNPPAV